MSITLQNLESALAGESMAHIKYRYFATIAREEGFEDVAKHFEHMDENALTKTLCGTPIYLAPEIISGKLYTIVSDLCSKAKKLLL